jgi:hypothetical protein
MTADRVEAIRQLLVQAEGAHGDYERTELGGTYDEEWPRWYAEYAVDHGIADLLGSPLGPDDLSAFLASSYAEFKVARADPDEEWAAYTARRIVTGLP